jgi:2-methylcitrate dehydratase
MIMTSHIKPHFDDATQKKILAIIENPAELDQLPVDKFTDLFTKP